VVGDNTFWKAVEFLDVIEEESDCFFFCDHCVCWNKVYFFGNRIHNSHGGIMSGGLQEFNYEIDAEHILPCIWNGEQLKFTNWRVLPRFRPEAEIAGTYILADVPRHLGPLVVLEYQF